MNKEHTRNQKRMYRIHKLEEKNECLTLLVGELKEKYLNAVADYEQEKAKNSKAIKHIELYINRLLDNNISITPIEMRYLLEILKGEE